MEEFLKCLVVVPPKDCPHIDAVRHPVRRDCFPFHMVDIEAFQLSHIIDETQPVSSDEGLPAFHGEVSGGHFCHLPHLLPHRLLGEHIGHRLAFLEEIVGKTPVKGLL